MIEKLDHNLYDAEELVEVRIPLSLPYVTGRGQYERIDGEAEVDGIRYTYVKRKMENDTLFLLCLPNKAKSQLYADRVRYIKHSNDIPNDKSGQNTGKKVNTSYEYDRELITADHAAVILKKTPDRYGSFSSMLSHAPADTEHQPPDLQA